MIAIVSTNRRFEWISCTSIATNLRLAYRRVFGDKSITFFEQSRDTSRQEMMSLAIRIKASRPSKIVFIDHLPHPSRLLAALDAVFGPNLPLLVFHIYGDFTYFAREWQKCESLLLNKKAIFICASPRQTTLLKRLHINSKIVTCPFPVDNSLFKFSPSVRHKARRKFHFLNDHKIMIYSGRLSLQKNVLELISIARPLLIAHPTLRLVLAGPSDDIGTPFFGDDKPSSMVSERLAALIEKFPKSLRRKILRVGNLATKELSEIYNAADFFISLSLHHDEDFGMAPAEAQLCGLPLILTDWGGYSQFVTSTDSGLKIPVSITKKGLAFDPARVRQAISGFTQTPITSKDRRAISTEGKNNFSIKAVATQLREIHSTPTSHLKFNGFTPKLHKLADRLETSVAYPEGPKKGTFYEEVYSSYVG